LLGKIISSPEKWDKQKQKKLIASGSNESELYVIQQPRVKPGFLYSRFSHHPPALGAEPETPPVIGVMYNFLFAMFIHRTYVRVTPLLKDKLHLALKCERRVR
jgi:hypothetical protein